MAVLLAGLLSLLDARPDPALRAQVAQALEFCFIAKGASPEEVEAALGTDGMRLGYFFSGFCNHFAYEWPSGLVVHFNDNQVCRKGFSSWNSHRWSFGGGDYQFALAEPKAERPVRVWPVLDLPAVDPAARPFEAVGYGTIRPGFTRRDVEQLLGPGRFGCESERPVDVPFDVYRGGITVYFVGDKVAGKKWASTDPTWEETREWMMTAPAPVTWVGGMLR